MLVKTKESDYPRPGYLIMDNLKFKFEKDRKFGIIKWELS